MWYDDLHQLIESNNFCDFYFIDIMYEKSIIMEIEESQVSFQKT